MNLTAELTAHLHTTYIQRRVDHGILTPSEAADVLESLPTSDAELSALKRRVVVDNLRGLSDEGIEEKQAVNSENEREDCVGYPAHPSPASICG